MFGFEGYVARRMSREMKDGHEMVRPAIAVATAGIALGLAVMIVAMAVVVGFKREVRNQVIGFGSHIQLTSVEGFDDLKEVAIAPSEEYLEKLRKTDNVKAVQRIVRKPGIIQTDNAFQGVMMKGVDETYNWEFFGDRIVAFDSAFALTGRNGGGLTPRAMPWAMGKLPFQGASGSKAKDDTHDQNIENWAIISRAMAEKMGLEVGDGFIVYFVGERLRGRKLTVSAIYETTFAEYDKIYILTDARILQQLNGWSENEYSTIEVLVKDWERLEETVSKVFRLSIGEKERYCVESIENKVPQIFEWLAMLDMNAIVILVLMMMVSGFCMISGLLILILERGETIRIFSAMGATRWSIRKMFVLHAASMVLRGMAWGDAIGLGLIAVQYFLHVIPLDAASYYVEYVPVAFCWGWFVVVNVGMAVIGMGAMVLPSKTATRD